MAALYFANNAGINFIHNHHPQRTPGDLHQKFAPAVGLLHPNFCPVGGDLLRQLLRGGHLSINDVCHFRNFHYNGKNWRLSTLWGLLVALKFYTFLKKIIQSQMEPKLKNLNHFSHQRKIENAKQFDCQAFDLVVLWKILLCK